MSLPDASYRDDAPYVCTLSPASIKVAKEDLNEDPKERMQQVQQLRDWIHRQPHLKCRTDNYNLLRFLRGAKFSQLRAREMLEMYYGIRTKYTHWFQNIDTTDKKLHYILDQGYLVPLPGKDKQGRRVMMQRTAALPLNDKNFDVPDMIKLQLSIILLMYKNEETQVHGSVMIGDHTNASLKHMMRLPIEDMKAFMKNFQKATPGRFKAYHLYNAGTIFESIMAIMKPILNQKFQSRMMVHSDLESLYKHVPMEILPEEYLPDDYTGPRAGTVKQICDDVKKQISTPEFRAFMAYESSSQWFMDETKKAKDTAVEGAFRKLNVD